MSNKITIESIESIKLKLEERTEQLIRTKAKLEDCQLERNRLKKLKNNHTSPKRRCKK